MRSRSRQAGPGKIAIRPARADDLDALVDLENAVFSADRISRRSFRKLLTADSAAILVVEAAAGPGEGTPISGYAALLYRRGTALARLYSLAVSRESAGRGMGRALLAAAERTAFDHERIALRLEVREDNQPAIALYRAAGYRPIGRTPNYYEDGAMALRFEKTLRGEHAIDTGVPYYEQTTDFTCGAACLMMALAREVPGFTPNPVDEIRLWCEATTVFMMSGPGGCDPHGQQCN